MQSGRLFKHGVKSASRMALLALCGFSLSLYAAQTDLANSPLSGASAAPISPNVMFIMDDSASMEWNYLPDWAGGKNNTSALKRIEIAEWQGKNSKFNGVAYNPEMTYEPPVYYTADGSEKDTTTYPVQDAANTSNWTAVRNNPYSPSDVTTSSLVGNAYYFSTKPGEFCKDRTLRVCAKQDADTSDYPVPAYLRWCNSAANAGAKTQDLSVGACQAVEINNRGDTGVFGFPRMPSPRMSRAVFADNNDVVTSVKVLGKEILSASAAQNGVKTLTEMVADAINECSFERIGACEVVGYQAKVNWSGGATYGELRLYAPAPDGLESETISPVITGGNPTVQPFIRPADNQAPGEVMLTAIHSGRTQYPNLRGKGCQAATYCTYDEEMTNYANWFAYYRTRMQTMKTSLSRAFASINEDFRVGFMSINNKNATNQMGDYFMNIDTFTPMNKKAWYDTMLSTQTVVDFTPLRQALAHAGKIYAGKLAGDYNSHEIKDPVQYACQQNVTILSTDGFWNTDAGSKLDGSPVGDQDGKDAYGGTVERPQLDAGDNNWVKVEKRILVSKSPTVPTWWQKRINERQAFVSKLMKRTNTVGQKQKRQLRRQEWTLKAQVRPLQTRSNALEQRNQYVWQKTQSDWYFLSEWQPTKREIKMQIRYYKPQWQWWTQNLMQRELALWKQPHDIYTRTYPLKQTKKLNYEQRTLQLQKRVLFLAQSSTGGGKPAPVEECTVGTGECEHVPVPPAESAWHNVTTCKVLGLKETEVYNQGQDSEYGVLRTVVECRYNPASFDYVAWSRLPAGEQCHQNPMGEIGHGKELTGNAVACRNVESGTTTVSQCQPDDVTVCFYDTNAPTNTLEPTCTPEAGSSGTGLWTISKKVECPTVPGTEVRVPNGETCSWVNETLTQTRGIHCYYKESRAWSPVTGTTTCTPKDPTGSLLYQSVPDNTVFQGNQVMCQWSASSGPFSSFTQPCVNTNTSVNAGVITGLLGTGLSGQGSNGMAYAVVNCNNATSAWTNWENVTSVDGGCYVGVNESSPTPSTTNYQCQMASDTGWQDLASGQTCAGGYNAATGVTTYCSGRRAAGTRRCTDAEVASNNCALGWTTWYKVNTCTWNNNQNLNANPIAYKTECKIEDAEDAGNWTAWGRVESCNPSNKTGSAAQDSVWKGAVQCAGYDINNYMWSPPPGGGSWSYLSSCTPKNMPAPNDGQRYHQQTECRYDPSWYSLEAHQNAWSAWPGGGKCEGINAPSDFSQPFLRRCDYIIKEGSPAGGDLVTDGICNPNNMQKDFINPAVIECGYGGETAWTPYGPGYPDQEPCVPTNPANPTAPPPVDPHGSGLANEWVMCTTQWDGWAEATAEGCTPQANQVECKYGTGSWIARSCDLEDAKNPPTQEALLPEGQTYSQRERILDCRNIVRQEWSPPVDTGTPLAGCTELEEGDGAPGMSEKCRKVLRNGVVNQPSPSCPTYPPDQIDDTPEKNKVSCREEYRGASTGEIDPNCNAKKTDPQAPDYWAVRCEAIAGTPTNDTLADVAQYYYMNDLRDAALNNCLGTDVGGIQNNVCENIVPSSGASTAKWQHMTTYTLGMGASGLMQYQADYLTAESGDYFNIKEGKTADHAEGICTWQNQGPCNWPKPETNTQTNIDDTWHAAVNGRGVYYSASDPLSLANGLNDALSKIIAKDGSLAAVTVSNPNFKKIEPGSTDYNAVYTVEFQAGLWSGNVLKWPADGYGKILTETALWNAQNKLDAKLNATPDAYKSRKIYAKKKGSNDRRDFTWANLDTEERNLFKDNMTLSQFCNTGNICVDLPVQTTAKGEPLFNFILGDRSKEGLLMDRTKAFRQRTHLLGDIVNSEATFVGAPPWSYGDSGYKKFKDEKKSRRPMLYVGANDGMMHALDEATGEELWAYVPSMVIPNLHRLADKQYADAHRFFVDGTPMTGDVCVSGCKDPDAAVWKTILVGGLNNGGKGYYALDITDPLDPKILWEFTESSKLGMSYGNPVITKLTSGEWVVIFASGYNNTDGEGHLFIRSAVEDRTIRTISTGEGSPGSPSGLSKITAWSTYVIFNNTTEYVYAGDLLGNVWRFDVNGLRSDYKATLLATLKDSNGAPQPITASPELGQINTRRVVFVGTGQLLGDSDLGTRTQQSIYAIKDLLVDQLHRKPEDPYDPAEDFHGNPRENALFVKQIAALGTCPADAEKNKGICTPGEKVGMMEKVNTVDILNVHSGWYVDFPEAGERINVDMTLMEGTLTITTNTPKTEACVAIASSRNYFLDYKNGGCVGGGTNCVVSGASTPNLGTAPRAFRDQDGKTRIFNHDDSTGDKSIRTNDPPLKGTGGGGMRRASWREIVSE